ncbi:unnamed protein product [Rotaria magnacalcarata]|uniref:Uncharacterized protein n=1 Tax=Rotaria magnacalcarata TaxID=392030 RepID=A0A815Y341_9BILA|nr:unnamed protein product [Rotaria magnacalcarata]CAF4597854.1 unnamed protein product [Rotaria magnacalcarata]
MVKKSEQEDLVNDVESLQLAQDGRIFIKASNFHFTPSANNALEVTNNIIKKENTLRERLLLSRFKVLAFEIVEKWSKCYERGLKKCNYKQTISLELWTTGYQWVKSNKSIFSTECDNLVQYDIPAGDETKITNVGIDVVKKMQWYTFDQNQKKAFAI